MYCNVWKYAPKSIEVLLAFYTIVVASSYLNLNPKHFNYALLICDEFFKSSGELNQAIKRSKR